MAPGGYPGMGAPSLPAATEAAHPTAAAGPDETQPPSVLRGLKRYKMVNLVGDGTYGLVYLALNQETREKVAIKTMKRKYHSWAEVMDLREVKSLKKLNHPNVVKLKEVIRENNRLYFVFEYIKGDLLGLMRETSEPFSDSAVRTIIFQILQALAYMHRNGFFHR
jgi:protein kinase